MPTAGQPPHWDIGTEALRGHRAIPRWDVRGRGQESFHGAPSERTSPCRALAPTCTNLLREVRRPSRCTDGEAEAAEGRRSAGATPVSARAETPQLQTAASSPRTSRPLCLCASVSPFSSLPSQPVAGTHAPILTAEDISLVSPCTPRHQAFALAAVFTHMCMHTERERETLSFPSHNISNPRGRDHQPPPSPGSLSTYYMHPPVRVRMPTLCFWNSRVQRRAYYTS